MIGTNQLLGHALIFKEQRAFIAVHAHDALDLAALNYLAH